MPAFCWLISLVCIALYIAESCSPGWPSDGTVYISNVELLPDPNELLISVNVESWIQPDSYCKIMNVSDGTVSMAMNKTICDDYTTRSWSTPDTDPTSTSIINATDMNGTVHIKLKRNNKIIDIDEILINKYPNLFYEQFTFNSMNTTFVLLASYLGIGEMIVIQFVSQSNNTMIYSSNIGKPTGSWYQWDVTYSPNRISVYEHVMAINVPLIPGPCDAYFIGTLQFNYNASNGYIDDVIMSKTDQGALVDNIGKKAYDWSDYGRFVNVWYLEHDIMNTLYLDLSKTMTPTPFPTIQPTFEPSLEPTIYPTIVPTESEIELMCTYKNSATTVMVEFLYILQSDVETESMSNYMIDIIDNLIVDGLNECIGADYNLLIVMNEETQNIKLNISLCTECNQQILAEDVTVLMKDFVLKINNMNDSNPMLRIQSDGIIIAVIANIKQNENEREVVTVTLTTEWNQDIIMNHKSDEDFWIIFGVIFGLILLCILVFSVVIIIKYKMDKQIYRGNTDNIQVCVDENNSNVINGNNENNMSSIDNGIKNEQYMTRNGDDDVITFGNKISEEFDNLMVKNWLNSIGFVQYLYMFIENGYDSLDIIKEISDRSELIDIGINVENDEIQIMHQIHILKELDKENNNHNALVIEDVNNTEGNTTKTYYD